MDGRITAKIYGLVRRDNQILVERIHEKDGTLKAYRPLGGTLEFSEKSEDGLRREFREELGTDITSIKVSCVAEEIFEYRGKAGHQIAFIYECQLADQTLYEQDTIERIDSEHGITIHAEWIDPFNIQNDVKLVPEDLLIELKRAAKNT